MSFIANGINYSPGSKSMGAYKSPKFMKIDKNDSLSPIHELSSEKIIEESELIDIIQYLFVETISNEELNICKEKLANFPQNLIPTNIPENYIIAILDKYNKTQNSLEEDCFILVIECFSMIDDYHPLIQKMNFFNVTIDKIKNLSPNSFLMLKILANIYDSLENKYESLNAICSLIPALSNHNGNEIFDYLIHFFYNYSSSDFATEDGSMLISNSLLSLLKDFEKKEMLLSSFSAERIFYIMRTLIQKFEEDFSEVLEHPIIANKNRYLFNDSPEVAISYIILSGILFYRNKNPFDLHVFDFLPFLTSKKKELISPSIWILNIMIGSSEDMANELNRINLLAFKDAYSEIDYNGKIEIAYLYQNLLGKISNDDRFQFFNDNFDMLFQFLDLENDEILENMLHLYSDVHFTLVEVGDEQMINDFKNKLFSNDFSKLLDDVIIESQSENARLCAKELSLMFQNGEENVR